MSAGGRVRVVADASALKDNRSTAGIGRYVTSLLGELRQRDDLALWSAVPPWAPPSEAWAVRFGWAQPVVGAMALLHAAQLVHGLASDPVLPWPLHRQVVTLHDVLPWTMTRRANGLTAAYLSMQRRRLRRCAAVIAVSQATADEAIDVLALDPLRVHVVPEATSPIFVPRPGPNDSARRRQAGAPDEPYLLWVGSLRAHDPRKGLDGILEAITISRSRRTPLVLAGSAGAESARLTRAAAELNVRLVVTGFVDDETLAALYRGAAAALLPSHHEGFGLTALEAMASGTPLVAARSANLPALAGDSALLVEAGDSAGLAAAIDSVLGDPAIAADLRARGPGTSAQYSWRRTAELTVAVYREVLGNPVS